MDRRPIVLTACLLAAMTVGAAVVIVDRPAEHLLPLAGHLGAGRKAWPIEALLAAPAGLLLNLLFVSLRQPRGGSEGAEQRRRWSGTFLAGVAALFAAVEAMQIGALYGWFPTGEILPRLLLMAAALLMAFSANGAAKLVVLGRDDSPASPRRLTLNRFAALVGVVMGVVLVPVSLWSPLGDLRTAWTVLPLALVLLFVGRAVTLALDARSQA